MANEKTPVVWDDTTKKHRPLGTGEKMGGLDASSIISSDSGNLIGTGSDGLAYVSGSGIADPAADNLIETSAQGKLKVDIDRITEWLDGHPQDAAALADAVNVVSGDEGNVISAGSDKGAYLSSAALAAVVAGMSAPQLQTLVAALADGETVVASGGKLIVNPTSAPKAKLQAITTALRKSGGGLSVDSSTGKLVVDFSAMDPAIMRGVVLSMVQEGGGLAVDANGQLYVNFDAMDTTKFEKLMSDMIDRQTVKSTGGANHFYVDGLAGSDSNPSERGAPDKPFKTIQACINYITKIYKFADTNVYVECQNIEQTTALKLPSFDRTTSVVTIRGATFSDSTPRNSPATRTDYSIKIDYAPSGSQSRFAVDVDGTGVYNLRNFDVTVTDAALTSSGGHLAALHVGDYTTCGISYSRYAFSRALDAPWLLNQTTGEHVIFITSYGHLDVGANVTVVCGDLPQSVTISGGDHAGTYNRYIRGFTISGSGSVQVDDTRWHAADATMEFVLSAASGSDTVIPSGTVAGDGTVSFKTSAALTIPAGQTSGTVACECTVKGASGNGVAAGTALTLDEPISGVSASLATASSGGYDRRLVLQGVFRSLVNCSSRFDRNRAYSGSVDVSGVETADYKFYLSGAGYADVGESGVIDATHNGAGNGSDVGPSTDTWLGSNGTNADGTDRVSYARIDQFCWYD